MGEGGAIYSEDFYRNFNAGMERSAQAVVPLVMRLVNPESVVDVGCGEGVWLAAFGRAGVPRILGMDGPWVDSTRLAVPSGVFRATDLTGAPETTERFDLCVSLEVAEHLPERSARAVMCCGTTGTWSGGTVRTCSST
jgi:2-polyprenyl-3-methyl-5-hydroxy-6-metoxy-1,4-benzoquinol methylase